MPRYRTKCDGKPSRLHAHPSVSEKPKSNSIRLVVQQVIHLMLLLSLLSACYTLESEIEKLEQVYGASPEEIAYLADLYGIELDEVVAFGYDPFPINHIVEELDWPVPAAEWDEPRVLRRKVEEVVRGYVDRCSTNYNYTMYTFYSGFNYQSTNDKEPLILGMIYRSGMPEEERWNQFLEGIEVFLPHDWSDMDYEWAIRECRSQLYQD